MKVGAHLVGASAATVANVVGVSKGTVSNRDRRVCDGHPFYCITYIPRHSQLKFILRREERGPHDTLKTKKQKKKKKKRLATASCCTVEGQTYMPCMTCVSIILSIPCDSYFVSDIASLRYFL
ncbi:hypothetical protein C0J52_20779 [Blattella germanica]|nr:hypothetical protein C0J52_20779 [Blattella germanica]